MRRDQVTTPQWFNLSDPMDATIIAAPSSTKNADGERGPGMHQTKKGNQWHFGMKAHLGVDHLAVMPSGMRRSMPRRNETCNRQKNHKYMRCDDD